MKNLTKLQITRRLFKNFQILIGIKEPENYIKSPKIKINIIMIILMLIMTSIKIKFKINLH